MAPAASRSNAAGWTDEGVADLLLTIMGQTNPALAATGWTAIVEQMQSIGHPFNENKMKKKFKALRDDFLAKQSQKEEDAATAGVTATTKRKGGKNDSPAPPAKKARVKAAAKAAADEADEAVERDEDSGQD